MHLSIKGQIVEPPLHFFSLTFEGIRSTGCAVSTAGISLGKRATPTRAASSVETL